MILSTEAIFGAKDLSAKFPSLTFPAATKCCNSVRVISWAGHVFGTRRDASFEKDASEIR
ncbi:hypothetical protein CDAR_543191, partial [Caerostris darwini]